MTKSQSQLETEAWTSLVYVTSEMGPQRKHILHRFLFMSGIVPPQKGMILDRLFDNHIHHVVSHDHHVPAPKNGGDSHLRHTILTSVVTLLPAEYAYVGYIGKRISMRKTRYMAMQKMLMEQRQEVQSRAHSGVVVAPEEHTPKSAVSEGSRQQAPQISRK